MRYLRLFLPFGLIFVLYAALPYVLAFFSGTPVIQFNEAENGALILAQRRKFETEIPSDCDIYFVGTSRTMADYDPGLFAQLVRRDLDLASTPCGLNLGNLGNSPRFLFEAIQNINLDPDLLILEFSPHLFVRDQALEAQQTFFEQYRSAVLKFSLSASGRLRDILHLNAALKLDPAAIYSLANGESDRPYTTEEVYLYLAFSFFGRGQTYNSDGQVTYRTYLNNPQSLQIFEDSLDTDLNNFIRDFSNQTFNSEEWNAYVEIIDYISPSQVVVVRPPVSQEMYQFENEEMAEIIERAMDVFEQFNILYVDLNPNEYSTLDSSHVDWIDSSQVTTDLAKAIMDWVKENFRPR